MANYLKYIILLFLINLLFACALPNEQVFLPEHEKHLAKGLEYEQNEQWDLASKEYLSVANFNPLGNFYLGNLLFLQNKLEDAEREYRTAMRTIHDNSALFNNLAWLLFTKKEKLAEAQELATLAVKLSQPDHFAEYWDTFEQIRQYAEDHKK